MTTVKLPQINLHIDYVVLAKQVHKTQPFIYDKSCLWWVWNFERTCWEIIDETDLMNSIYKSIDTNQVAIASNKVKSELLTCFKMVGRKEIPPEPPKNFIQFKNKFFDVKTGKIFGASPAFFNTNPIPWEIGDSVHTPIMDQLFTDWVGGEFVETLYEIIAYCCYIDYPVHRLFCLVGAGRNGKSQFQKIVQRFIGTDNICSTELDLLLNNRFESAKLFKKLVCSLGETNFGIMSKTSLLKKLCGGDLIGFEFKNKNPFDGYNYAKIIINSNSLPTSFDTSDGFYRRWLIVDFPNTFKEGKEIVETIPEEEYKNLARKSCLLIKRLLETGRFTNEGTIEERRQKYIDASNPLPSFISEHCDLGFDRFVLKSELRNAYIKYLQKRKKRKPSSKEFTMALEEEGLFCSKTRKPVLKKDSLREEFDYKDGWWIEGVDLKCH